MLAAVPSITTAMRIKKMLSAQGIDIEVVQTPRYVKGAGCSYSVKFDERYLSLIKESAERVHSKIKAVYTDEGERYDLS